MLKKWDIEKDENYLLGEKSDCYYFWYKGKIDLIRDKESSSIISTKVNDIGVWNSIRQKNQFKNIFEALIIKHMKGRYNGQTRAEFSKNYKRVRDIVTKSAGDIEKAKKLSQTQANRITDEWKAINRSMAARESQNGYLNTNEKEVYEVIFEVFFQRAYELGTVTKQAYREYKLERLGI